MKIKAGFVPNRWAKMVSNWEGTWEQFLEKVNSDKERAGKDGPALLVSSYKKDGGPRTLENVEGAMLLVYDFDDVKERPEIPFRSYWYTTASHGRPGKGNRYRAIIPLASTVDVQGYRLLYTYVSEEMGWPADRACRDATRLHYTVRAAATDGLPFEDGETEGEILDPSNLPGGMSVEKLKKREADVQLLTEKERIKIRNRRREMSRDQSNLERAAKTAYLEKALETFKAVAGGKNDSRHEGLYIFGIAVGKCEIYLEPGDVDVWRTEALSAAMQMGLHDRDLERHFNNGLKFGRDHPLDAVRMSDSHGYRQEVVKLRLIKGGKKDAPPDPGDVYDDWRKGLDRTAAGKVKNTMRNIAAILEHDERYPFRPIWRDLRKETKFTADEAYTDEHDSRTAIWFGATYGFEPASSRVFEVSNVVAEKNGRDPLKEYLSTLEWDGQKRLDTWLVDHFGAEDKPYTRDVSRKWLVSAVARALKPGCKADCILVLEGAQGAKKSSGLAALAGEDFFSDAAGDPGSKDSAMLLQGPWIVEIAELDSFRKAALTTIKHWVSQQKDRYRPPYGRTVITSPRKCVFAATTNETNYLRDMTGNRRFWPVLCNGVDVKGVAENRDQIWAEAIAAYKAGEIWWLDSVEAGRRAIEEQQGRMQVDPWNEEIHRWLAGRTIPEVTFGEVHDHLDIPLERRNNLTHTRIRQVMEAGGWRLERRRGEAGRVRVWVQPDDKGDRDGLDQATLSGPPETGAAWPAHGTSEKSPESTILEGSRGPGQARSGGGPPAVGPPVGPPVSQQNQELDLVGQPGHPKTPKDLGRSHMGAEQKGLIEKAPPDGPAVGPPQNDATRHDPGHETGVDFVGGLTDDESDFIY